MLERLRKTSMALHSSVLRLSFEDRPLPLSYWLAFRRVARSLFSESDPIVPPLPLRDLDSSRLHARDLRKLLADGQLNAWTLDVRTIDLIWERLHREQPRTIVECGAGASTIIFAAYAAASRLEPRPVVISLEQDGPYKLDVERRLFARSLGAHAHIIHTPVDERGRYAFDLDLIENHLKGRAIDWIMIDGPSGPEGCRDSTLPTLAPFCRSGARWLLDDALRDGELNLLEEWSRMRGISVDGIIPVGKGLAIGTVDDPGRVRPA